ncbi:MAG TPA: dTDP-4-dehydrorhamnose reductase, partial [Longimicrobiaceae bacterium]|nr:dTDP-4-dehydrorhamnose reductase [Longimicrobiaceae bacterium]
MSDRPRILLTGATGQVGWELRRTLAPLGEIVVPQREAFDLARPETLRAIVLALRPAVVVNAAAYTAVDAAESDGDAAHRVNAVAPGMLAGAAAEIGALMVHFSTDYVFDGSASRPYREDDATAPLGVYGGTKRDGERAVAAAGGAHLVFRTSWVYGLRGHNFLRTILRLAGERDGLRVVDDQHGAPTWSRMVAGATAAVLARCAGDGRFALPAGTGGLYHLTAADATTWCGFARAIVEGVPSLAERRVRVDAIPSAEFPTAARRPASSVLDCGRLARHFA